MARLMAVTLTVGLVQSRTKTVTRIEWRYPT